MTKPPFSDFLRHYVQKTPSPSFGDMLKRYREAIHLTQEGLEAAAHRQVVVHGISDIERGKTHKPHSDTLTILADALQLRGVERDDFNAALDLPWKINTILPSMPRYPLTGRRYERTLLENLVNGEGRPVLYFAGEPGVGKSRLLEEAASLASNKGWAVLHGGCYRQSTMFPYAPLVDILFRFLEQRHPIVRRWDLEGCFPLLLLLPELAPYFSPSSSSPQAIPPSQELRLMFAAIAKLLENIGASKGALLILDDLQWAGSDAINLIGYLARATQTQALRMVLAYRTTEVDIRRQDQLATLLADLEHDALAHRVDVGLLPSLESSRLLTTFLQDIVVAEKEQFIDQVIRQAGGLPFYLVSFVEGFTSDMQGGVIAPDGPITIPQNVTASIYQRVSMLPPLAHDLFDVLAIAGRPVAGSVLGDALQQSYQAEAMVAALENGVTVRIIDGGGKDGYHFTHDLIREALLRAMGADRRAMLHAKLAQSLERGRGELPVEQLAYHYGQADEWEKAVFYLEKAGDRARAMYAQAEAVTYYQKLIEQLAERGKREEAARVCEKLANLLHVNGRYQEARDYYQRGLEFSAKEDALWHARLINKIAYAFSAERKHPEAEHYSLLAESTLGDAPATPPPAWYQLWIQIHLDRLWIYYFQYKGDAMAAVVAKICSFVERQGTALQQARLCAALTVMRLLLDRFIATDETLAYAREATARFSVLDEWDDMAQARFYMGFSLLWHGDSEEANAHFAEVIRVAEQTGNVFRLLIGLTYQAIACRRLGQMEEVFVLALCGYAVATQHKAHVYLGAARGNLAWIAWRRGDYAGAERHGRRALHHWQKFDPRYPFQWVALWPLIGVAYEQQRYDADIEYVRLLFASNQQGMPEALERCLIRAMQAWDEGESDDARHQLEDAVGVAREKGYL